MERVLWRLGLGGGLIGGAVAVAYALGRPARWPVQGPRILAACAIGLVIAVLGIWLGPRRWAVAAAIVTGTAVVLSGLLTVRFIQAVEAAGGTVNPLRGLVFTSMAGPPDETATYRVAGGQPLTAAIYRPRTGPAPVIMYIHGGGWVAGSATDNGHDLRWYAHQGWLVVSVNYRLATPAQPTWNRAPQDVACALAWTADNAARWGGDAGRIAVAGDSAGGTLALGLGSGQSTCDGLAVAPPRAVLVQYPIADFADASANPQALHYLRQYTGGNAIATLDAVAVPTLIIVPDDDSVVPPAGTIGFADRNPAATLVRLPYADHAYDQMAAESPGNQAGLTIRRSYLIEHGLGPATGSKAG